MEKKQLIELTVLWEKADKHGEVYLSGNLGNTHIMIFKNHNKKLQKHPDYRILISLFRITLAMLSALSTFNP